MLNQINGLHHVTALAGDPRRNNAFYTDCLGLRRVKKTVNFDAPDIYHLYFGDAVGTPGTVMTYFPQPGRKRGRPGTSEVATTSFSVPAGALGYWQGRLSKQPIPEKQTGTLFGDNRLLFSGPDGESLAVVEREGDTRAPWSGGDIDTNVAVRGFHGVSLRLRDSSATIDLLKFMGYEVIADEGNVTRLSVSNGNGADVIDIETSPDVAEAVQGAGSVHHIAFSVKDRGQQQRARVDLIDAGFKVTPVIDRNYFWAIYFRSPGGVLFEIATDEPGFANDEPETQLGQSLKLPAQHEHLRARLETHLQDL